MTEEVKKEDGSTNVPETPYMEKAEPGKPASDQDTSSEGSATADAVKEAQNSKSDGVVASATSNQDPLPHSTDPNPIASGEGTSLSDKAFNQGPGTPSKSPLVGERREAVWLGVIDLENKVLEVYGHLHDEVREIIANIRAQLINPSN